MTNSLTQEAKIELIATKLMGWQFYQEFVYKGDYNQARNLWVKNEIVDTHSGQQIIPVCDYEDFRPYDDWNDWRMVEEKIMMGDEVFFEKFQSQFGVRLMPGVVKDNFKAYVMSDLEKRCDALVSLLQS